jgi:hypothetical protein
MRTRALLWGLVNFLCLLCFPPRRLSSQGERPQNGSASTGKLSYSSVRCGNRSMRALRIVNQCAGSLCEDSRLRPVFLSGCGKQGHSFRDSISWKCRRRKLSLTSRHSGPAYLWLLPLLHLGACAVIALGKIEWGVHYMIYVDFPFSLLLVALGWRDDNFLLWFATLGTLWWYLLSWVVYSLLKKGRSV